METQDTQLTYKDSFTKKMINANSNETEFLNIVKNNNCEKNNDFNLINIILEGLYEVIKKILKTTQVLNRKRYKSQAYVPFQ